MPFALKTQADKFNPNKRINIAYLQKYKTFQMDLEKIIIKKHLIKKLKSSNN